MSRRWQAMQFGIVFPIVLCIVFSFASAGGLIVSVFGPEGNGVVPNAEFWAKSVAVPDWSNGNSLIPDTSAEVRLSARYLPHEGGYQLGGEGGAYFRLRIVAPGYQPLEQKILLDGNISRRTFLLIPIGSEYSMAQFGHSTMLYHPQPQRIAAYCNREKLEELKRLMESFGVVPRETVAAWDPDAVAIVFRKEGGFARDSCPELAALRSVEGVGAGPIYRMDYVNGGDLSVSAFSHMFQIRFHPMVTEERIAELMEEFGVLNYQLRSSNGTLAYYFGELPVSIGEGINEVMVEMMERIEVVEAGVDILAYLVADS